MHLRIGLAIFAGGVDQIGGLNDLLTGEFGHIRREHRQDGDACGKPDVP